MIIKRFYIESIIKYKEENTEDEIVYTSNKLHKKYMNNNKN